MNTEFKKYLLKLARSTLKNYFQPSLEISSQNELSHLKRGLFVTLTKRGELRGCIGYIQPIKSIYEAVKENAINAAFHDPRFPHVQKEELKEIKIEISLLTLPKKLEFKNDLDLIKKLRPRIDGVIVEKNDHQATFLPQVWEELSDPFEFLQHLSWKAGLSTEAWKTATIYIYQAEVFSEK